LTRVTSDQLRQHAKEMYPLGPSHQRELAERHYEEDAWEIVEGHPQRLYDVVATICDLIIEHAVVEQWASSPDRSTLLTEGGSLLEINSPGDLIDWTRSPSVLEYHWTLALVPDTNESVEVTSHKVDSTWTPILWFTKGEYLGGYVIDTAKTL